MAQDAFGNWICGLTPAAAGTLPGGISGTLTGVGAPDNGLGDNGDTYIDLSTGDFYTKAGDAWNLVSGGVAAAGQTGVVDPEGVVSGALNTWYINTVGRAAWYKTGGGSGNTGWTQVI